MKNGRIITKVIAAGLAVAFTAGIAAGCGHGSNNVQDDLRFDEFGDPIFEDVNLKVWSIVGDPDDVYLEKVNKMFNDYYRENGLQAKITPIVNGDFYQQVANTITTDPRNAPDVIIIHSERLSGLASNNVIVPMSEYFEAAKTQFDPNAYLDNVIGECYYKNELYGVPLDVHAGVWFVRSDILEKNGLEKPTTLTEFVEVCNALVEKYEAGTLWHRAMNKTNEAACQWTQSKTFGDHFYPVVMSKDGGIEQGWIPQTAVFQNGGALTDDRGYPAWNTKGLENVMQMFRNWQTGKGDFKGTPYAGAFVSGKDDTNTVWSKLASGEAVFSCEGPWWIEQRFDEYEDILGGLTDEENRTYAPLDIMNMSKMYALDEHADYAGEIYGVGHCFSICRTVTSKTKRVAAALYAKFMTENAVDYMQGGHLPACKAILESQQYKEKPFYERYLKEFGDPENFVMLGNTPYYSAVYEGLKNVYSDIFNSNFKDRTVAQIVKSRYDNAVNYIKASEEL